MTDDRERKQGAGAQFICKAWKSRKNLGHWILEVVKEGITSRGTQCLKSTLSLTLFRKKNSRAKFLIFRTDCLMGIRLGKTHYSRDRAKVEVMGMCQHGSNQLQAGCHQHCRVGMRTRKLNQHLNSNIEWRTDTLLFTDFTNRTLIDHRKVWGRKEGFTSLASNSLFSIQLHSTAVIEHWSF